MRIVLVEDVTADHQIVITEETGEAEAEAQAKPETMEGTVQRKSAAKPQQTTITQSAWQRVWQPQPPVPQRQLHVQPPELLRRRLRRLLLLKPRLQMTRMMRRTLWMHSCRRKYCPR